MIGEDAADYSYPDASLSYGAVKSTIEPAEFTLEPVEASYTGEAIDLVTIPEDLQDVAFEYTTEEPGADTVWSREIPQGTDAGAYPIYYRSADPNYSDAVQTLTSKITSIPVKLTPPEAQELTYNGEPQALVTPGEAVKGTMEYRLGEDGEWSSEIPTAADAGTYEVYYRAVGEAPNYEDAASEEPVTVTIAKAVLDVAVSMEDWTYGEAANEPVIKGVPEGVKYDVTVTDADGETVDPKDAGAYTVTVTVPESDNYESAKASDTFKIKKAALDVAVSMEDWTFGETANEPQITGVPEGAKYDVTYEKDGEPVAAPEHAGSYTVALTVPESDNYLEAAASAPFAITKASNEAAAPTALALTYNGKAQTLVKPGDATFGEMEYSLDGLTFSTDLPTGTDAGDYDVYYRVSGDEDHEDVRAQKLTVTIDKAALDVAVSMEDWTYGEAANEPQISGIPEGVKYDVTIADADGETVEPKDAGDYTVTVTVPASDNYKAAKASDTFAIQKGTLDASISVDGWTFGETPNEPQISGVPEGIDYTVTYEKDGVAVDAPTEPGDYTAILTVPATENYAAGTAKALFTIAAATETTTTTTEATTSTTTTETTTSTTKATTTTTPETTTSTTKATTTTTPETTTTTTTEVTTTTTEATTTTTEATTTTTEATTTTTEATTTQPTVPTVTRYEYEATPKTGFFFSHDDTAFAIDELIDTLRRRAVYDDGTTGDWTDVEDLSGVDLAGQSAESVYDAQDLPYTRTGISATISSPLPDGGTDIQTMTIGDVLIARKGDADLNGQINAVDASNILVYATEKGVGREARLFPAGDDLMERFAFFLADVNGNGALDAVDASCILVYSTEKGVGHPTDWEEIIAKNEQS